MKVVLISVCDFRNRIDTSKVKAGVSLGNVRALYTTAVRVRTVKELLETRPESCPSCGSDSLLTTRPQVLFCEGCRTEIQCPTHTDLVTAGTSEKLATSAYRIESGIGASSGA